MQDTGDREESDSNPQTEIRNPQFSNPTVEQLQEECRELQFQLATYQRQERIRELLLEHDLPLPHERDPESRRITSPAFLESLASAADDAALRKLIEDRATAVRRESQPFAISREQSPPMKQVNTAKEFARALKRKVRSSM